jgi:hypothetical protein
MFQVPATVMGMIGSAFMVASFAPGAIGDAVGGDRAHSLTALSQTAGSRGKSDRIAAPVTAAERRSVSVVELVGISQVKVILKDANGDVLFTSDPQSNTTYFSKDTDLPVITLKEESASHVTSRPATRQSGDDSTAPKRRGQPHGCIGAVSPLAQAGKEAAASLCVTSLEDRHQIHG